MHKYYKILGVGIVFVIVGAISFYIGGNAAGNGNAAGWALLLIGGGCVCVFLYAWCHQCPKCKELWTTEEVSRDLLRKYNKIETEKYSEGGRERTRRIPVYVEEWTVHYKCSKCGHKSEKVVTNEMKVAAGL